MENQNTSENKPKKKINLGSIIFLIGLLLIAVGVLLITFFPSEEQTTNNQSEDTPSEIENKLGQTIELSKETEDITFDENLRIKFIGTQSADLEDGYTYKAEIYLNNELITDNFYTGANIWSSNFAATFDVTKVKNTYIMKSFIAKQCNGAYVLVLSSDKTFKIYDDVSLNIDEEASNYTITKCTDCMTESTCQTASESIN